MHHLTGKEHLCIVNLNTLYVHQFKQRLSEFLSIHRTDHVRINWVIRKQLPVESLMDMIVHTKTYRIARDAAQCYSLHMYRFAQK